MRTRTFWNHQTGERYTLSEDDLWQRRMRQDAPGVLPDLDRAYGGGFVSPIDGEHITSRSQLRAHEAKHGVKQCGDYRRGEVVASLKKDHERRAAVQRREEAFARSRVRGKGIDFSW
jgi:hypothetical protein